MAFDIYTRQIYDTSENLIWQWSSKRTSGYAALSESSRSPTDIDIGTQSSVAFIGVNDVPPGQGERLACTGTVTIDPAQYTSVTNDEVIEPKMSCDAAPRKIVYIKIRRNLR